MEALIDKKEVASKPKRIPIPEDTDLHVVRFQNMDSPGAPLEASIGPPISENIRDYVLRDGLVYNLGQRLIDHLNSLGYPIYKNIEDPNFPGSGQMVSRQVGIQKRYALIPENNPAVTVYEHSRQKLNHKVMPGALHNSPNLPKAVQRSSDVLADNETEDMKKANLDLERANHKLQGRLEEMVAKVNTIVDENASLKKELKKDKK